MLFLAVYCTDTPLLIVQVCVFNNKVLWEEYYFLYISVFVLPNVYKVKHIKRKILFNTQPVFMKVTVCSFLPLCLGYSLIFFSFFSLLL